MANLRIGMRVRARSDIEPTALRGAEGVIVARFGGMDFDWIVQFPGVSGFFVRAHGVTGGLSDWSMRSDELEPPTDPRCAEMIADLNRFAAIAEKRPLGEKLADRLRFA